MQRNASKKWLICDPVTPVGEIAFFALAGRLDTIPELLERAALRHDDDVEHVHRLRVATRRAEATLELFGPFGAKRPARRVASTLSTIRKAAGRARDLDVFIERSRLRQKQGLMETLERRRKQSQKRIRRVYKEFVRSGKLKRHTLRLLRSMPTDIDVGGRIPFDLWAHNQLRTCVEAFFDAWPHDSTDLNAIHQFRIQAKGLRYTLELVVSAFPKALRDDFYPQIEEFQNVLGDINDHVVACRKLEQWIAVAETADIDVLEAELANERQSLRLSLANFDEKGATQARHDLESAAQRLVFES
jgi:CHAD domain-containing protein